MNSFFLSRIVDLSGSVFTAVDDNSFQLWEDFYLTYDAVIIPSGNTCLYVHILMETKTASGNSFDGKQVVVTEN